MALALQLEQVCGWWFVSGQSTVFVDTERALWQLL
jgi:hypothetical protein